MLAIHKDLGNRVGGRCFFNYVNVSLGSCGFRLLHSRLSRRKANDDPTCPAVAKVRVRCVQGQYRAVLSGSKQRFVILEAQVPVEPDELNHAVIDPLLKLRFGRAGKVMAGGVL